MNKTRRVLPFIALCLAVGMHATSPTQASPFADASQSVVQLTPLGALPGHATVVSDSATGVVIALPNGETCLLTSCRCMTSSASVTVRFRKDGRLRRESATLIGRDPSTDVVVFDAGGIDATPASLSSDPGPGIGEKLYLVAVGPDGRLEFAESIVTEIDLHNVGVIRYERLTRVSSPQQVRLGSAAFDESGNLFGFVVHKTPIAPTNPVTYVYVNPVSAWLTTITRLRESGRIIRPWLGLLLIQERDQTDAKAGARVKNVLPDSPASRAGVQVNDVIVGYDSRGTQGIVCCITDLTFAIAELDPEASIGLNVTRGSERLKLSVPLEAMPEHYISGVPAAARRPVASRSLSPPPQIVRVKSVWLTASGTINAVANYISRRIGKPIRVSKDADPGITVSFRFPPDDPAAIEQSFIRAFEALGFSVEATDESVTVNLGE